MSEQLKLKVGDIVFVKKILNRCGLSCAATITKINDDNTVDAIVWNMGGPGADGNVTNAPISELEIVEQFNQ